MFNIENWKPQTEIFLAVTALPELPLHRSFPFQSHCISH